MSQRNESENTRQAHKAPDQEYSIQGYLASGVDLKTPDHRDWEREDDEVADKGQDAVCHADEDKGVGDAVSGLCFIPKEGDGRALQNVGGEGCNCPALERVLACDQRKQQLFVDIRLLASL